MLPVTVAASAPGTFRPRIRKPGKKVGDKNVPVWPQYPVALAQIPADATLHEICQQYPNGLQWGNLDAFIQRRWSPSEIVKCMPGHCQDDVYGRKCIDKTMFMTKRLQKAEAKLRRDGMMETLRSDAARGRFLRKDGRPRGSFKGPSTKMPRRGWVDRQRKKDGVVVVDESEDESDEDEEDEADEANQGTETDGVGGDVEDEEEDAVGEEDTDYDYLASQGM